MLQCEQCSCWLHIECVNVPAHVADNCPFICPLCIMSSISLISSLKSEISHSKAHIIKLEKSCESLSTHLSVQLITGLFIYDTTMKSTASSLNSSQIVLSNSHPSKSHPISPNPAHLNTSNARSNPSLPPKFLNKPPRFLSQAQPPHKPPLLPTPHYHIINILQLTRCLFFQLLNHLHSLHSSLIFIHQCNFPIILSYHSLNIIPYIILYQPLFLNISPPTPNFIRTLIHKNLCFFTHLL